MAFNLEENLAKTPVAMGSAECRVVTMAAEAFEETRDAHTPPKYRV